jgi:hypothetical protein
MPGELVLRLAMIEELEFAYPPGNNYETSFPHVVRSMYPGSAGTILSQSWISGQTQTLNLSGKVPASIKDKTQVRFVAFIQDDSTHQVLQAAQSQPFTFALDAMLVGGKANFIQCAGNFNPVFTLLNKGFSTLTSDSLKIAVDDTLVSAEAWTGSLLAGDSAFVMLSSVALSQGTHTLSLISQNPNAGADGNPGNDSIIINVGVAPASGSLPLKNGFETSANPGWYTESVSQLPHGWSIQPPGYNSNYGYQMDFWDVLPGNISNLYTPPFNLQGVSRAVVKFDRAYAPFNYGPGTGILSGYSKDSLYVQVSIDCGVTWQTVYAKGDTSLATAPSDNLAPFYPSNSQWVNDSIDISTFSGNDEVIVRFKAVSGNGNELYIDNVSIYNPDVSGIAAVDNAAALYIYPNPANGFLKIEMGFDKNGLINYQITDIAGRLINTSAVKLKNDGSAIVDINTASLAPGMYLLSATLGNQKVSRLFGVVH